jgi:hypothetical protein
MGGLARARLAGWPGRGRARGADGLGAAALGLKPLKLRVCTSLQALNACMVDIPFAYHSPYDAVAILEAVMGTMDLKDFFWSFPTHRVDRPLLAVELDGRLYVARRAQFGGKLSPLIANAVMAEF